MVVSSRPASPSTASADETRPVEPGAPRPLTARRGIPLSAALVLLPALVALTRLLIGLHRPFTQYGDNAILEAAVRRVATGTQLLGPYSRFGFHQPGPAFFFVQAPFAWLTGGSPRALFLGATTINFGAALGCVLVVRRWCGERSARWTAVVVILYIAAVTPAMVTDPWNPYVLALPLLAAIVLAAAAAAGSWTAAAGALVVGSYLVQTHVATALTVAAVAAVASVAGLARVFQARGQRPPLFEDAPRRRRRLFFGTLLALLALLWTPPLLEQATHAPGNLSLLADFFSKSHPEQNVGLDHSVTAAASQIADHLLTLPFGRVSSGAGGGLPLAVAAFVLLVSAGLAALAWRRRDVFVVTLAGVSLTGTAAALWSTTRVVGEVMPYLLVWSGVLFLPTWIGLGIMVGDRSATGSRWSRAAVLAAVVPSLLVGWAMLRCPLPPIPDDPEVGIAARLAEPWLTTQGARHLRIRIGQHDQWPLAAGVIDRLDAEGLAVTVDEEWTSLFGDQFAPTGHEQAEVWINDRSIQPPVASTQLLGSTTGSSLWGRSLTIAGGTP